MQELKAAPLTVCRTHPPPISYTKKKIDVLPCRQPTLEEREFLEEEALEQDRLAIRLERLHFDGRP